MAPARWILPAAATWILTGCSNSDKPAPATPGKTAETVRITQFYTTTPKPARGEKATLCYGVENARSAWLSPPKRDLSPALARCIEVEPGGPAIYTLTAEGVDGKTVTKDLALGRGAARAHIVNIDISAAEVNPGDLVNICYKVENAQSITVEPIHFKATINHGCFTDQPRKTTTYVVTATGADGDSDQERAIIKVR